jgi:hypothetical protein
MGYQVRLPLCAALAATIMLPAAAAAQAGENGFDGALGADATYMSDADETEVIAAGINFNVDYDGPEDYRGIRIERVWYNPLGQGWSRDDRVYLRAANKTAGWSWAAKVGTDGHTALGSVSVHDDARWRKELFVERDVVETPSGVAGDLHYTLVGASVDVPLGERDTLALVAGVQDFTGENRRIHLRANLVHVIKPDWGLSAQLRTRWFRNSDPGEGDYYSPRWYAQVLPVLQLRRTTDSGWRWVVAGGIGVQRDAESDWRRASYFNAQVTSPRRADGWAFTGAMTFSETPTASGRGYHYLQVSAGITRGF